jgi:hypothetical protein
MAMLFKITLLLMDWFAESNEGAASELLKKPLFVRDGMNGMILNE